MAVQFKQLKDVYKQSQNLCFTPLLAAYNYLWQFESLTVCFRNECGIAIWQNVDLFPVTKLPNSSSKFGILCFSQAHQRVVQMVNRSGMSKRQKTFRRSDQRSIPCSSNSLNIFRYIAIYIWYLIYVLCIHLDRILEIINYSEIQRVFHTYYLVHDSSLSQKNNARLNQFTRNLIQMIVEGKSKPLDDLPSLKLSAKASENRPY